MQAPPGMVAPQRAVDMGIASEETDYKFLRTHNFALRQRILKEGEIPHSHFHPGGLEFGSDGI